MRSTREAEIDTWDQVARAWRRWWTVIEAGAGSLSRHLVERCGVGSGETLLDVGTGIGEPARTAAGVVGPRGRVVGVDPSAVMLAIARERAGSRPVRFLRADAAALPFAGATFDAAVCRFGLMHVSALDAALAALRRVLRTGARFATAVWGAPSEVPFLSTSRDAVIETLGLPPDDPRDGPFRLHAAGELIELLARAGFQDVEQHDIGVRLSFDDAPAYARFVLEISGWTQRALADVSSAERERVRATIETAASHHGAPDGRIVFENRASVASARR